MKTKLFLAAALLLCTFSKIKAQCTSITDILLSAPRTTTTISFQWFVANQAIVQGYEFEYGPAGFTPGEGTLVTLTENEYVVTNLQPGTLYGFRIRAYCGNENYGNWVGPFTMSTAYEPANLPYSTSFEQTDSVFNMGWNVSVNTANPNGGSWGLSSSGNGVVAPDGNVFAAISGTPAASDAVMSSRNLNLQAGTDVTVSYWMRKFIIFGSGNINNITVSVYNAETDDLISQLAQFNNYESETFTELFHTFTVPDDGVYYITFQYTAPPHSQQNAGAILLDHVTVSGTLGTDEILFSGFSLYPNPANDVINIASAENTFIDRIDIIDVNGRVVKFVKYSGAKEARINISDLAAGMYVATVSSGDDKIITKKIVKN